MEDLSHYNPEGSVLRKAQMRMLDILIEFDRICNKHNIPYWIEGGTLLGARRHGGFIPWDDDLDVQVFQKDFKRLQKVLQMELPGHYKLQTKQTDKKYIFNSAKIRDTKSFLKEDQNDMHNFKYNGIFIDLFPIEPVVSMECKRYADEIKKRFEYRAGSKHLLAKILNTSCLLLTPLFYAHTYFVRLIGRMFNIKTYAYSPGIYFYHKHRIENLLPLSKISFEGKMFNCPHNVDAYLTEYYGDFMKIPPPEKRAVHASEITFYD